MSTGVTNECLNEKVKEKRAHQGSGPVIDAEKEVQAGIEHIWREKVPGFRKLSV